MTTRVCASLLLLVCGMPSSVRAVEVRQNVAFTTLNQNPWVPGEAFVETFRFDDLRFSFNHDLPDLSLNPAEILLDTFASMLDVPVPDFGIGGSMGGSVSGTFDVNFGYHVNGGRFNMKYPAVSSIDVATFEAVGGDEFLIANTDSRISTSFHPGIEKIFNGDPILLSSIVKAGGSGYGELPKNNLGFEQFVTPEFTTQFPTAAAWANVNFDVGASAFVEGHAFGFKARTEYGFHADTDVTLAYVGPNGVNILGRNLGFELDEPIGIGGLGSITLSYPDLKVASEPIRADGTLHGFGSSPLIKIQGQLEKLIPVAGGFLSHSIGPLGYTLLETRGGPSINVYQDFTFTPHPKVILHFSEPVQQRLPDGSLVPTMTVETALGNAIDIQPMFGTSESITIQPTYVLNNTFRNETGLSVGVSFDLEALKLMTPFGDLGPAYRDNLTFSDLIKIPVHKEPFEMPMGSVAGRPFSIKKANSVVGLQKPSAYRMGGSLATLLGRDVQSGLATYRMAAVEDETDSHFEFNVTGVETTFFDRMDTAFDFQQTILTTAEDVVLSDPVTGEFVANLGRSFCVICPDATPLFDTPLAIDIGDETLHLSPLFEYPSGVVDVASDPELDPNHVVQNHVNFQEVQTETIVTTIPTRDTVLFSNINEPSRDFTPIPEYWAAQAFTTDEHPHLLQSIDALIGNASDDVEIVAQLFAFNGFEINELLTDFTAPTPGAELEAINFVPSQQILLQPSTSYWFVLGATSGSFDWSYEDSTVGEATRTFGPGSLLLFADSVNAGVDWTLYSLLNPYQIQINVLTEVSTGDINSNGLLDPNDIDALAEAIRIGDDSPVFDMNRDGQVTIGDYEHLILNIEGTYFGDANLDHDVGFADFLELSANFGGSGGWGQGDFDADGNVSFPDFLLLSGNFGKNATVLSAVPEPSCLTSQLCLAVLMSLVRGSRQSVGRIRKVCSIIDGQLVSS